VKRRTLLPGVLFVSTVPVIIAASCKFIYTRDRVRSYIRYALRAHSSSPAVNNSGVLFYAGLLKRTRPRRDALPAREDGERQGRGTGLRIPETGGFRAVVRAVKVAGSPDLRH